MAMKRHERSEKAKNLHRKISTEYSLFKYKMLSGSAHEIYDKCKQIYFYECLYEYFQYCEKIEEEFLKVSREYDSVLQELWRIYLKYEYLSVENWGGIEELLRVYALECGRNKNGVG